jgi:hypothetical protein
MLDSTGGQGIPQIHLHGLPLERCHLLGGSSVLFGLKKRQSRLLLLLRSIRPWLNRLQQPNAVVEPSPWVLALKEVRVGHRLPVAQGEWLIAHAVGFNQLAARLNQTILYRKPILRTYLQRIK